MQSAMAGEGGERHGSEARDGIGEGHGDYGLGYWSAWLDVTAEWRWRREKNYEGGLGWMDSVVQLAMGNKKKID